MSYTSERVQRKLDKKEEAKLGQRMTIAQIVGPSQGPIHALLQMKETGEVDAELEVYLQAFFIIYPRVLKLAGKELFDVTVPVKVLSRVYYGTPVNARQILEVLDMATDLVERCKRVRDRRIWMAAQRDCAIASVVGNHSWDGVREFALKQGISK